MQEPAEILIIGAGPTGMAAALFLVDRRHRPRIIEKRTQPASNSKAFGVNARTLELLSESGLAERFIANGRKMQRLIVRHGSAELATLRLDEVEHRFPFMLVQSQAESERMLQEALAERGVQVERGVEVLDVRQQGATALVEVVSSAGRSTVRAACVLSADGAGSTVRRALGISFEGESYDEAWRLYDVELDTQLPPDDATVFLLDYGGMFVVRLEGSVWRVLGNVPDLLRRLPEGTRAGKVRWESEFEISNVIAGRFAEPPFYLAGDAAHIHAGIGARGMNLDIEDAYVFAALYGAGQLDRYDRLRRPVVEKVVGQIQRAMGPPRAKSIPGRILRAAPWLVPIVVSVVHKPAARWVLGLDHELGVPLGSKS